MNRGKEERIVNEVHWDTHGLLDYYFVVDEMVKYMRRIRYVNRVLVGKSWDLDAEVCSQQ